MRRLVLVLKRDKQRLQGPEQPKRKEKCRWDPEHHMQPNRRMESEFQNQRGAEHDQAEEHDHKNSRTVTGVNEPVGKLAGGAFLQQVQIEKALEKSALTTAGTPASHAGNEWADITHRLPAFPNMLAQMMTLEQKNGRQGAARSEFSMTLPVP